MPTWMHRLGTSITSCLIGFQILTIPLINKYIYAGETILQWKHAVLT